MVSIATIDAIVTFAIALELIERDHGTLVGRGMLRSNMLSLESRYGTEVDYGALAAYEYRERGVTPIVAYKQARCFAYQACEYEAWDLSYAALLCRAIVAVCKLQGMTQDSPEYQDAPWGIEADE